MIVLVALGWGLFWSAILSNALTAAVTAICSTGLGLSVSDGDARRGVFAATVCSPWCSVRFFIFCRPRSPRH